MAGRSPRLVWLSLTVLLVLSLSFGYAALRTSPTHIAAAGPVVTTPEAPSPIPLPDVEPMRGR